MHITPEMVHGMFPWLKGEIPLLKNILLRKDYAFFTKTVGDLFEAHGCSMPIYHFAGELDHGSAISCSNVYNDKYFERKYNAYLNKISAIQRGENINGMLPELEVSEQNIISLETAIVIFSEFTEAELGKDLRLKERLANLKADKQQFLELYKRFVIYNENILLISNRSA